MKLKKTGVVFIATLIFLTFINSNVSLGTEKILTDSNSVNQVKEKNKHVVGEFYGGGIVCWIDSTGTHGYICSLIDLGHSEWSNIEDGLVSIENDSIILTGDKATKYITYQQGHLNSAAKICVSYKNLDYGTGVYSDWFLPTRIEVNLMVKNCDLIQNALNSDGKDATTAFTNDYYWTSSEHENSDYSAYDYDIKSGSEKMNYSYKGKMKLVRAFRFF